MDKFRNKLLETIRIEIIKLLKCFISTNKNGKFLQVSVILEKERTFLEYGYSGKTYYPDLLKMQIGESDLNLMMKTQKLSEKDAMYKLISHEILHLVLGHFSDKYKDLNKYILNLAGDMEINNIIQIKDPFITPSMFNFPDGLSTMDYYDLLIQEHNNEQNSKIKSKLDEIMAKDNIDRDSVYKNLNRFSKKEKLEQANNFYNKYYKKKNGSIRRNKQIENIAKQIKCSENSVKICQKSREISWSKFNNRNDDSSLIKPGFTFSGNNINKKYENKAVIFVDVSWSMSDYGHDIMLLEEYLLNNCNVDIAEYNYKLTDVKTSKNMVPYLNLHGSTSALQSIIEYEEKYGKINRLYLITDGADNSLIKVNKLYKNNKMWRIYSNGEISELKF